MICALRRAFVGLVIAVSGYLIAAVLGAVIPAGQPARAEAEREISLHLVPGPIHYDMLLPLTPDARQRFAPLGRLGIPVEHPEVAWIIVGWGSEAFYTSVGTYRDVAPSAIWRAVTGDASVLRVDLYGAMEPAPWTREIRLSEAEYAALLTAIRDSLLIEPSGAPRLIQGPAPGHPGWFLAAEARFHVFRTCNTWISEMLRKAGLRFGIWTPVPYAVRLSHAVYYD